MLINDDLNDDIVTADALHEPDVSVSTERQALRTVPFAFAKRHGVLVTAMEHGEVHLLCRPDVKSHIIAEVRRHLDQPLRIEFVRPDEFDAKLQRSYEQETDHAMQMMDDLDGEADLFQVAQ